MLVISRRANEEFSFPNLGITIKIIKVAGKVARIGIDAPDDVRVLRSELLDQLEELASVPAEILDRKESEIIAETPSDYMVTSGVPFRRTAFENIIEQLEGFDDQVSENESISVQLELNGSQEPVKRRRAALCDVEDSI